MKYRVKTFGTNFIVQKKRGFLWKTETFDIDLGLGPDSIIPCPYVFYARHRALDYIKKQMQNKGVVIKEVEI